MVSGNGSELARLEARIDRVDAVLNDHLLKCADANGRLALTMRLVLIAMGILIVLVAPDNPIVKAAMAAMGVRH